MSKFDSPGAKMRGFHTSLPSSLILFLGLAACSDLSSPLAPLNGQPLQSVSIADHNGRSIVLTEPADIALVASHLAALPTRREGKVNPEFELKFTSSNGTSLRLRLGRGSVGPDVPASDVTTRWYFPDDALHDFVASRLRGAR